MGFSVSSIKSPSKATQEYPKRPRLPKGTYPLKIAYIPKTSYLPKRSHLPEYVFQSKTGLFIFRMKVPHDCQGIIYKKELKYSLRTHCIYSARKHIASLLPLLQGVFEGIRSGIYTDANSLDLHQTIKDTIFHTTRDTERSKYRVSIIPITEFTNHKSNSIPGCIQSPLPPPTPAPSPEEPNKPADNTSATLPRQSTPETTFSNLKASFLKEKEISNGWRLKTQEDHESVFSLFIEAFGNMPVSQIDKAILREFKAILIQLPPNMRKVARYRDKNIKDIIAMKPDNTLSAHTVNKYLSRLSNLFSYAVSHGYMTANPAGGLKVKLKNRPDEEREAYTTADLKKLFKWNNQESLSSKPYCKWVPLIALYTGCRLEEICQLHLEDIRNENGTLVFDINDKHEKNLKTLSSTRLVPIHPMLIEKGLIQYVYSLKAKGEQRLFPELRQQRDGYGQTVSKWFQRYKERCGIEKGKTFHSFRHTFITHLKHKQVDPFMLHELDGHAIDSETMGRYGKRFTPEILLKEAIEKIDYEI